MLATLLLTAFFAAALPLSAVAQALFTPSAASAAATMPPAAKSGAQRVDALEAEMVADVARAVPGQSFRIGLRLKHDPHWHTYWRNPGDSGLPTRFEPSGPVGTSYDEIVWPAPKRLAIGDLANYGYEDEIVLSRQVSLPPAFKESRARFEVLAQWLVCKDVCIPGEAALALEVSVGARAEPAAAGVVALIDDSAKRAPETGARMQAGWWRQGMQAYVVLPAGMKASRAEFFPYFERVVSPAAAQALVEASQAGASGRPGGTGARVADPVRGEPVQALKLVAVSPDEGASPAPALPEPAAGVLLADGKAIEIGLQPLADAPSAGRLISVAEAVSAVPAVLPATSGLLDRLRGRGTAATAAVPAPSAAASAFPSPSPDGASGAASGNAFGTGSGTLAVAIIGALIGGLILNLMPCVFPVIGLKVLSFAQSVGGDSRAARRHALTFSAGVVLSFLVMGVALLALRSAGDAVGWGFQMQSPLFVGAMALLFVLIGLNLFGVFETGVSLTRLDVPRSARPGAAAKYGATAGDTPASRGLLNSFWTGAIAVLVATPCTAPFMGSAIGFTVTSPPGQTLLVFAALGIGMAAPYLVLGSAPGLLRWLPRPGPWLLAFRQLLAFPMLATAAWLAWVLTIQSGADGLLRLLMSAILVAFVAWVYGRAQSARLSGAAGPGLMGLVAAVLAGVLTVWQLAQIEGLSQTVAGTDVAANAGAGAYAATGSGTSAGTSARANAGSSAGAIAAAHARTAPLAVSSDWQAWSPDRVSQALAQGRPVLVDFTAAWCISCQANKKLVLERQVVRRAFEANNVALLRADWTSRDPAITAELARFGRNGVPLYLAYASANEPPLILPELLTVDTVLAALGASR